MKPKIFSAVIFDLDGTLLDTLDDLAGSMNAVLGSHGYAEHPVERYKMLVGGGIEELVRRSLPAGVADAVVTVLLSEVKEHYSKHWAKKTRPYPGMTETLKTLRSNGIVLSVLSNKPDEFTKKMTERFFPDIRFTAVFGERKGVPVKPDPAGAQEICGITGFKPGEFLFLGDSGTDMRTAVNAGMYPVGALWGFRDERELLENGAKKLVREPSDILKLF